MDAPAYPVPSVVARFANEYFNTFARLLDPNLPVAPAEARDGSNWSAGQTVAFATICSLGFSCLLAVILKFCA